MKQSNSSDLVICHLLIGIPGSGKSTIAQQWAEQSFGVESKPVAISTDRIREQRYGDAMIQGNWAEIELDVVSECQTAIAQRRSIIYDATNVRRAWRMQFLSRVNDLGTVVGDDPAVGWMAWRVDTPLETCLQHNRSRDRQVPQALIEQFYSWMQTEPVERSEGFIAVNSIPFNPFGIDWTAGSAFT